MSERLRSMSEHELGEALSGLDLSWPPAPDLAPAVLAATRAARQPRIVHLPLSRTKRALLIAAATVLLLAGAAVAAKIVIDLGAVVVEVTPAPTALPSPSTAPTGTPITLERAAVLLDREVSVPPTFGRPDRVWVDEVFTELGPVVRVTMAWRPGEDLPALRGTGYGAVLMVFEGDANQASKDLYEDTGVLRFQTVDGVEYHWTTGTHLLQLLTGEGVVYVRVEGNVLLWRDGRHTMRLETALPRPEAIRIARSMPLGTP
jgi:hypothetical protein